MNITSRSQLRLVITILTAGSLLALQAEPPRRVDDSLFERLEYRHIGPIGNRVSAVAGVSGDWNTYYIGAASGGVFKSEDGGASWKPIFDSQPAQSIGALAVAPSDANVIWVGTGEAKIRSNISIGNGVYRSTDGGRSFTHLGLEKTGRIARIVVHPADPDVAWVAALGHCYGPQPERGVFRTLDGGRNWEKVLFVDEDTGASDLIIDPSNPRILFAGTWQMAIWTWGRQSGGPGSGLHRSTDGGATWERLSGQGLPKGPWGKVALSTTRANPQRVYALIETNSNEEFEPIEQHQGVLWRSDDGGDGWKKLNSDHVLAQRPHYYSRVVAAPDDENTVYFLSTQASVSLDGGATSRRFPVAGDHHDMWIDPGSPQRMIVGHDQGISISTNGGRSWHRPQLPIAQMYHVHTDRRIPYNVYGNRQDGPSMAGPSNTLTGSVIPIGAWHSVGGCESGFAIPDPEDPHIVWSGCYEGILDRYDARTGHSRNVSVWPDNAEAWPGKDLEYRFQWTFPIAISSHDSEVVYVGSQYVHRTQDGGQSWTIISPDLSTDDKSKQQRMGGLTPDDAGPTIAAVLFAIAESPLEAGLIWAGTNDGLLHVTRDGGENWVDVTDNLPGLPPWGTVSNIEPSRYEAGKAYVSVDLHQVNSTEPYVYRTEDYGATWTSISAGIPRSVFSYVHVVREDPRRSGLLYLGTENSIFVSFDDGENWHSLQSNLPHAPLHWLTIQEDFNDLVVATYGRGFWILDDITPLQQLTQEVLDQAAHLFEPRPAYRFRFRESHVSQPSDPAAGRNPAYGASIHYSLAEETDQQVEITIHDSAGALVRKLGGGSDGEGKALSKKKGIHRVHWDLRYEPTSVPKLRTPPRQHSHVPLGEKGWRPLSEGRRYAPLAPPGNYTVKLQLGDLELEQRLQVVKDPNSSGTLDDIAAQTKVLLDLHSAIKRSVEMIEGIEWIRRQLLDLREVLEGRPDSEGIIERARKLDDDLQELENEFFDLRLTNARQDSLWWGRKLYSKMLSLAGYIDQLDAPPTNQQLEVCRLYKSRLADHEVRYGELQRDVGEFNTYLAEQGIGGIVASSK